MPGVICAAVLAALSTPAGFTDNLPEALKSAKEHNRNVFMVCSGSDWCGWCQRLEQEVLSSQTFLDNMTNEFELVYIDMPNDKSRISEWGKKHNEEVCVKYGVKGFPTCYILDADGKTVSRMGYEAGGADKYSKTVKYLKENQADIDKYIMPLVKKVDALTVTMNKMYRLGGMEKVKKMCKPKLEKLIKEAEGLKLPDNIAEEKGKLLEDLKQLLATME